MRGPGDGTQRAVAWLGRAYKLSQTHLEIAVETENDVCRWYALRVRSRHEYTVGKHLEARGYKSFLPLYKCRKRWSDRFKEIEQPLFPGYVFCQFKSVNQLPILSIPGVVHVVGVGRIPAPVDESEITAIKPAVLYGL